ncbi:MAG: SRPBCC domain-containing protein [Acidimicrobiia bacterium]|jgi:uncharacterized protein YndB with AHSA1/START domain
MTTDLLVSLDRVLPASPEKVFEALTDPEKYSRWMGPEGSKVTVEKMDVVLGGELRFTVTLPDSGMTFELYGYYEEVDPPNRLVHSWATVGDEEVSTVAFELEPHGDDTRLHIRHHGLTKPEDVAQNEAGWAHQLDRLEKLLT